MSHLKPLHPHEFLSWMAIPNYPGVYILGSFARHVTIYSQQMRAFNLIDALCKTGQLRPGARIAVVGGGVAGLTAAAAAAVRGAKVSVIESDKDFFPIQREAGNRYLHPHIYDWPLDETEEGRKNTADFPFLNWEADEAQVVFKKLKEKWTLLFTDHADRLTKPKTLMETRVMNLHRGEADVVRWTLETDAHDENDPEKRAKTVEAEIVILAVGFGREFGTADVLRYWEQSPFDAVPETPLRWLVSGCGDGGLTDLMRLCIEGFRHDAFVKKHERDPKLAARLRKLLTDKKAQHVRTVFEGLLEELDEGSLISRDQLRKKTTVVFNAPADYLEVEGSSILNKFLVFQLEKLGAFTLQAGRLRSIPTPDAKDRKYTVEFVDENDQLIAREVFDRLVIRHGPARPINEKSFPEIWAATEDLRNRWAAQSQSNDRTRVQIWDAADYDPATAPNPIMFTDEAPADVDLHCVIVESTDLRENETLTKLVSTALDGNAKDIGLALKPPRTEGDISAEFETININKALRGQKEYNRAVSLVCKADIAVIDVTEYEPGIMLLLGIRSAIKRGVTIVTTNRNLDSAEWSRLPFNLKELYPLSLFSEKPQPINSPQHPVQIIGGTIARALRHYHSLPFYQDVPAYEAVRRFDPPVEEVAERILWLCSFHSDYGVYASYIQRGYMQEYGKERNDRGEFKYLLERIIEVISPQIVTQKLYSAIRRTTLCLIDWTFWSPNVFFELGVRLAVSNFGPICLLASDAPAIPPPAKDADEKAKRRGLTKEHLEQHEKLKKLFQPLEYRQADQERKLFEEIRARHEAMKDHEKSGRSIIPPTFGAFPSDHTYKFVGGLLSLQNEPGAATAHAFLSDTADSLLGVANTSELGLPVLYANVNNDLDKQARIAAKEVLIAAWYYLSNRYSDELQHSTALQKEYETLSIRLANLLRESEDAKDHDLRKSIRKELRRVMNGADR